MDILAKELLQSKNEKELREYLLVQMDLLMQKKEIDNHIEKTKNSINQLNKDQIELRKCNAGVSSAFIKVKVEEAKLDKTIEKLEKEIEIVKDNIKCYQNIGDIYKMKLKNLNIY